MTLHKEAVNPRRFGVLFQRISFYPGRLKIHLRLFFQRVLSCFWLENLVQESPRALILWDPDTRNAVSARLDPAELTRVGHGFCMLEKSPLPTLEAAENVARMLHEGGFTLVVAAGSGVISDIAKKGCKPCRRCQLVPDDSSLGGCVYLSHIGHAGRAVTMNLFRSRLRNGSIRIRQFCGRLHCLFRSPASEIS